MFNENCLHIDLQAARSFLVTSACSCKISSYLLDGNLAYQLDILVQGETGCELQVVRRHDGSAKISVLDAAFPKKLFNSNSTTLIEALESWATFGWNARSTLARPLKGAVTYLNALCAEVDLASGKKFAPAGLMVVHNTRETNVNSILDQGLMISKSQCFSPGVWVRPPSFGKIESSRFKGNLSLIVDASGLRIKSASSYEIVIAEDIAPYRFSRAIDLASRMDA